MDRRPGTPTRRERVGVTVNTTGSDTAASASRLPDRWWLPAVLSLLLAVCFVVVLLLRAGGDVSLLVHAGPPWTHPGETRPSLTVQGPDDAFDGQFFYRLGVSPLSTDRVVAGVENDLPSLRNARWGYGALAWVASAGDPDVVPWALVGVNLAAAFALGAAGGGLARSSGLHASWGLLFALWPGFAYSISMDTSELVAGAFVLAGLLAARRRHHVLAASSLVAAVITRDTTTVVPFGFFVVGAANLARGVRHRDAQGRATDVGTFLTGVVPLVAFVTWQLLQRARFGVLALTSSGDNNLAWPLTGLVHNLADLAPPADGAAAFRLLFAVGLVGVVVLGAATWRHSSATWPERVAWVPAAAVVVVLNTYLWSGATAFMRAGTEVGLLTTVIVLGSRRIGLLRVLAAGSAFGWVLTVVAQTAKLG